MTQDKPAPRLPKRFQFTHPIKYDLGSTSPVDVRAPFVCQNDFDNQYSIFSPTSVFVGSAKWNGKRFTDVMKGEVDAGVSQYAEELFRVAAEKMAQLLAGSAGKSKT